MLSYWKGLIELDISVLITGIAGVSPASRVETHQAGETPALPVNTIELNWVFIVTLFDCFFESQLFSSFLKGDPFRRVTSNAIKDVGNHLCRT